jgi:hypothetical protein
MNTSGTELGLEIGQELIRAHYVIIMSCNQAEIIQHLELDKGSVTKYYYLMPEKFIKFFVQLEASFLNPFVERFQYLMDLSFQAGLPHIWNVYHSVVNSYPIIQTSSDEFEYLKLEDLSQVFSILGIGYGLSVAVLLIEIFFHDVLRKLKFEYLGQKLRNRVHQMAYKERKHQRHPKYQKGALYYIIHRRKRVKRLQAKKLKVRRIYVQPRFPVD